MTKLNIGECALSFLGSICRTKQGYMLDGAGGEQRIHADDAKFLIGGGVINLEDLQDLPGKGGSKKAEDEGT